MGTVYIFYEPEDFEVGERLAALLRIHGVRVRTIWKANDLLSLDRMAFRREGSWVVGIWSDAASRRTFVRDAMLSTAGAYLIRLDNTELAASLSNISTAEQLVWEGDPTAQRLLLLIRSSGSSNEDIAASLPGVEGTGTRRLHTGVGAPQGNSSAETPEPKAKARRRTGSSVEVRDIPTQIRGGDGRIARLLKMLSDLPELWRRGGLILHLPPTQSPAPPRSMRKVAAPPDPVFLSATAPRACAVGESFTASLVAFVSAARVSAMRKLARLGEPGDRLVEDIAAGSWREGAPVTVFLSGHGASVVPTEVSFEWNGKENVAAFVVTVPAKSRLATVVLTFSVVIADVVVSFIPMRVNLSKSADQRSNSVQARSPDSAFASYASLDSDTVAQKLSTLSRWAPGLVIFQACLDLNPGETFKPMLAKEITQRDVFLLFWSRRAAVSPWVRWEYKTALAQKGLAGIIPMPLEHPAIAPPPPELADLHGSDRFMLAGYAQARVREQAA